MNSVIANDVNVLKETEIVLGSHRKEKEKL